MSKLLIRQIKAMDKTSDEFADLFHTINEMYFDFQEPDSYQQAARVLNLILHRGDEWMIESMVKIGNTLFEVVKKDIKASHASFVINDKTFLFDLYQNKDALESVHKMFRNAVLK